MTISSMTKATFVNTGTGPLHLPAPLNLSMVQGAKVMLVLRPKDLVMIQSSPAFNRMVHAKKLAMKFEQPDAPVAQAAVAPPAPPAPVEPEAPPALAETPEALPAPPVVEPELPALEPEAESAPPLAEEPKEEEAKSKKKKK